MDKRDMVDINSSDEEFDKLYQTLTEGEESEKPRKKSPKKKSTDEQPQEKECWQKSVLMYLHDIVGLLLVVILLFTVVFRIVVVSGTSMNYTLLDGDFLLVLSNTFYTQPKAGDVIVASKKSFDNGAPVVKRVIATAGQQVDIRDGAVFVDGNRLDEAYTWADTNPTGGVKFPVTVPDGCVFVLGDNRGNSTDSRSPMIGMIDTREIVGKVIFLFLPGTNKGVQQKDFSRIGAVS